VKPQLGDDQADGWLLLGGQGLAHSSGQGVSLAAGGATLSAHDRLAVAVAGAALSSNASPGSGGGSNNGGSHNTTQNIR
jgi:hypothetical protein